MASLRYNIELFATRIPKATLASVALLLSVVACSQTFNIRPEINVNSFMVNVWETDYGYLTSGLALDTVGPLHSVFYTAGFSFTGEQLFEKCYGQVEDGYFPFNDANAQLNDSTFLFASEHYVDGIMHAALIWINAQGDTLQTRNYPSPYYPDDPLEFSNWMVPTYLVVDNAGNIYVSCAIAKPTTSNDFCILKILPDGELDWTYVHATDSDPDICQALVADGDGIIAGCGESEPDSDELVHKIFIRFASDGSGVPDWIINVDTEFIVGYPWEFVLEADGIVVASEATNDSETGLMPMTYKIDLFGQSIWNNPNEGIFYDDQRGEHLVKSPDGGYLQLGHQYEFFEEPDPLDGYFNWNAWLVKYTENGEQEWQRFYHNAESTWDEHTVYDLKTTSDGGYIFCGDATDLCYTEDCVVSGQSWLVKVDEYGCLVPGCQVGILENEETVNFLVGPNPANDFLNIYLETANNVSGTFSLYDMEGRLVRSFEAKQSDVTYILDMGDVQNGLYVLSFETITGESKQQKVVVQH